MYLFWSCSKRRRLRILDDDFGSTAVGEAAAMEHHRIIGQHLWLVDESAPAIGVRFQAVKERRRLTVRGVVQPVEKAVKAQDCRTTKARLPALFDLAEQIRI